MGSQDTIGIPFLSFGFCEGNVGAIADEGFCSAMCIKGRIYCLNLSITHGLSKKTKHFLGLKSCIFCKKMGFRSMQKIDSVFVLKQKG
jgi:hypothetical protein